jgi:PST family polysaccharide transporter
VSAADAVEARFGAGAQLRRLTGRGAVITAAFQVGLAFVTLLRGVAVAGFVTAADYGLWGFAGLALWMAMVPRYVGVNEKYVQQDEADQELAFQRAFTVELLFALVGAVLLCALVPLFALITGHDEMVAPGLVLVLAIPAGALQFPIWAYYRAMDFRRQRLLQAAEPVVASIVVLGLAVAGAGYWSFVGGVVAGAWAGAIVALRHCIHPLALRLDRVTLRVYVGFSAPLFATAVAVLSMFGVIYLAGSAELGLAGLGAFTLAGNILTFTDKADAVITDTLYPALCAIPERSATLAEAFVKSNRLALLWAVPFGLGLSLFAADLIHFVIGDRWEEAVVLLQLLGAATAVHHIGFNWHAFYRARGHTGPIAVTAVAAIAVFVAVAPWLMSAYGTKGLGLAFLTMEVVGLSLRAVYVRRMFPEFRVLRHSLRALLPSLAVAALLLAVRSAEVGEREAWVALVELGGCTAAVLALTLVIERPLLREALGYAIGPRPARA